MIYKLIIIIKCWWYGIENYTINSDMSIDVNDDVYLSNRGLTELPLKFNIVDGDFWCNNNKLTNLKGSPRKCDEFYCYDNNLTSLKGAPDECEYFSCLGCNKLTSLKGAPKCNSIKANYDKLNLDNEDLYIIEALANWYDDKELQDYLKTRQRNDIINSILN